MTICKEKYKSSVSQVLKICKAFSNFDFNSTIRKKYTGFCNCLEIERFIRFRKVIESFSLTGQAEDPSLFIHRLT